MRRRRSKTKTLTLPLLLARADLARGGSGTPVGDLEWRGDALCAQTDPEVFFADKGGSTLEARQTCLACTVRVQCLEYALATDQRFGVWGGLSERERRRLKRRAS